MSLITQHVDQPTEIKRSVWFTGTTAIVRGQALCYDYSYATSVSGQAATDDWGRRSKSVALPSSSNNLFFAGVAANSYSANSNGQLIEIFLPGSTCQVLCLENTTINSTMITAIAQNASSASHPNGWFGPAGFPGRGSALALQTKTNQISKYLDGTGSLSGTTLTKTGAFAGAVAGDKVYILGGGVAATAAAGPVAGLYTIASVTSDDAVVLSSAPGNGVVSFYCVSGYPLVMAYLMEGNESGCCEFVNPLDATATPHMVGGYTNVLGGGLTFATSDSTATLANGTRYGILKGFEAHGALTTHDHKVTVTAGEQTRVVDVVVTTAGHADGNPMALASFELDADNEKIMLEWLGGVWRERYSTGATLNAS